jgi:predicted DsbA family dithiol-disulfide isomerase
METAAGIAPSARLTIDVWADVLCPWCYVGEQRLEKAVEKSAHASEIELKTHTFQLDPTATKAVGPLLDRLSKKFGVPIAQARSMEEGMAKQAASEGLPYAVDRAMSSTFDMLRLVHLGAEHGLAWEYLRSMQAEVFSGSFDAFADDTLIRIGTSLGIPADEIRDVLSTDRYTDAVHADHDAAVNLGARGVPFTVLGNRLGVPGAASVGQYQDAINKAWKQVNG